MTSVRPDLSLRKSFSARRGEGRSIISDSDDRKCSPKPPKMPEIQSDSLECMLKGTPCCNCHSNGRATCAALRSTCACRKAGRQCSSCFPMSKGKCSNHHEQSLSALFASTNQETIQQGKSIDEVSETFESLEIGAPCIEKASIPTHSLCLVNRKMIEAFAHPLLNSDGRPRDDLWGQVWERITKLRGKLYSLPGGAIAKEFISCYDEEVNAFAEGSKTSESMICFPTLMLQKDKHVKKTNEIRQLLKRRLKLWKAGLFLELVREAEQCDRNLPKSSGEMTSEKESKIFSDLILQGRLREAVRFITDRQGGGVMDPHDDAIKPPGKTVLQVLIEKHPEQRIPDEEDFMTCESLPPLVEVEITNAHVEKAARKMYGSAGISGFDAYQLQGVLLRHGKHSEKLRSSFAKATSRQANKIITWEDIRL